LIDIRAVFFDLDGTLRLTVPSWGQLFDTYVVKYSNQVLTKERRHRAQRWEHHYWAQSLELLDDLEVMDIGEQLFWINYTRRRLNALGFSPSYASNQAAHIQQALRDTNPTETIVPDAIQTLITLQQRDMLVALVSNRNNSIEDLLVSLGLREHLAFVVISGEVGHWKPDPAIFDHALRLSGTDPAETVYVGDNYFADVVGAKRAGLHPVLVDPCGIFNDPGCPVITTLSELPALLS
jgi:putative hydrolase of the HAD superfamily